MVYLVTIVKVHDFISYEFLQLPNVVGLDRQIFLFFVSFALICRRFRFSIKIIKGLFLKYLHRSIALYHARQLFSLSLSSVHVRIRILFFLITFSNKFKLVVAILYYIWF